MKLPTLSLLYRMIARRVLQSNLRSCCLNCFRCISGVFARAIIDDTHTHGIYLIPTPVYAYEDRPPTQSRYDLSLLSLPGVGGLSWEGGHCAYAHCLINERAHPLATGS